MNPSTQESKSKKGYKYAYLDSLVLMNTEYPRVQVWILFMPYTGMETYVKNSQMKDTIIKADKG